MAYEEVLLYNQATDGIRRSSKIEAVATDGIRRSSTYEEVLLYNQVADGK